MKVRTALAILAIVNIISLGVVAGVGLWTFSQVERANALQAQALRVDSSVWHLQSTSYNMLISDSLQTAGSQWMSARESYIEHHNRFIEMARGSELLTGASAQRVETLSRFLDQVTSQFDAIDAQLQNLQDTDFDIATGGILRRIGSGDAPYSMYQVQREMSTLNIFLNNTESQLIAEFLDNYGSNVEALKQRRFILILATAGGIIVLSSLYVLFFARSLYRRIRELRSSLSELAEGHFDVALNTKGKNEIADISRYVQRYIDEFSSVIRSVQYSIYESDRLKDTLTSTSEQSASSVEEMTANIDSIGKQITNLNQKLTETGRSVSDIFSRVTELTQQIEDQSSAVSQSSSAVEEMAASIDNVAKITTQRTEASDRLVEVTKTGSDKVTATNEVVQQIAKSVEDIMEIIGIINKIAGQTSILSMNAAIEAAHAGEYGHGFSVVAEEIRSLSDSTNQNAKRIREQLEEISKGALRAQELSDESSSSFSEIQEEVNRFTDSLKEISATTDELSSGTQEMLKATNDLSNATQRIREAGEGIESETRSIDQAMNEIKNFSQEVESGMYEISSGTREIASGMTDLNEISRRNSEQIEELSRSIQRFRLAESDGSASESSTENGPERSNEER